MTTTIHARPEPARGGSSWLAPTTSVTAAERLVLQHLRQGLSNRAIGAALMISPRTVESHISHLLAKTGCSSRMQLLLWALAER